MGKRIHAAIISWEGHHDKAHAIAAALVGHVEKLSIIYSNRLGHSESGAGNWIQIDDSAFFGRKFKVALATHQDEDFLIQIQADASYDDWGNVIALLREAANTRPQLGVWAPNIDWCFWTENNTVISPISRTTLCHVTHTDAIVWAFSREIVTRMHELDYSINNLGWGIDIFATCCAASRGLDVLRDQSICVRHERGSGYGHDEARVQMDAFFQQMNDRELACHQLVKAHFAANNVKTKPRSLKRRLKSILGTRDN